MAKSKPNVIIVILTLTLTLIRGKPYVILILFVAITFMLFGTTMFAGTVTQRTSSGEPKIETE